MARNIEEVTVTHEGGPMAGEAHTHPAYAQIGASRVQGRATLYGSDFQHQHYITIRIAASELKRSLSNDWRYERGQYIEVDLSEAQWATFVSSMNQGNGVPCTLTRLGGKSIPGLPNPESRKDQFHKEARETCAQALKRIEELCAMIENSTMSNKAKEVLIKQAMSAGNSMTSSLTFVLDQFGEHMEKTVEKAKIEINAYVAQNVMRAGIQAIGSEGSAPLTISFGNDNEVKPVKEETK